MLHAARTSHFDIKGIAMLFIIGDIIFIVLGIPLLFSMHKWKRKLDHQTPSNTESEDDLFQKRRSCKQMTILIAFLVIVGITNLVYRFIKA